MPKFACRCGYLMNLSNGAPSFEMALIPESRIEKIADSLDESENVNGDEFYALIDEVRKAAYLCPSCGRIHVDAGNGLFNSFFPERDVAA